MKSYAYAKLNLALKILGQRPDGYHELDMIMQRISLCDELTIQKQAALTVSSDLPLPAENTMTRAAQVFFEYTGITGGANIAVKKNIPAEAGLGGGSSDGAAVLAALNELYGTKLRLEELLALGQKVGADVPFFIMGACARATGTGEILSAIKNKLDCVYLLAKPVKGVSTKDAYKGFHTAGGMPVDIDGTVASLASGDLRRFSKTSGNDLMPAALRLCPDIGRILYELKDADAAFMTGSGSCVFGVYGNKKTAHANMERLRFLSFVDFVYVAENK